MASPLDSSRSRRCFSVNNATCLLTMNSASCDRRQFLELFCSKTDEIRVRLISSVSALNTSESISLEISSKPFTTSVYMWRTLPPFQLQTNSVLGPDFSSENSSLITQIVNIHISVFVL